MATTYLTRTFGSAGNQKTWTWSAWIKRSNLGTNQVMFGNYTSASIRQYISFNTSNQLFIYGQMSGSDKIQCNTSSLFRDVNAWYHIVVAQDTTQGTGSNRMKIYVNGVQQTLSFTTTPSVNDDIAINDNGLHLIGAESAGNSEFSGIMSHVHFCDGTALAPTVFGSTDSTTGEWKINTSPSFTLGTNGFTVLKDGNTITDQSSNSNDFSLTAGTLTKTEDNPSNVFATGNPLEKEPPAYANGNLTYSCGNVWRLAPSTLASSSGKYYFEVKNGGGQSMMGIVKTDDLASHSSGVTYTGQTTNGVGYYNSGVKYVADNATSYGASYTTNDIIGVAMDLDNLKLYFSKNGTWQNSGVPTSGSTGTGAIDIPSAGFYHFGVSTRDTTNNANYGNGYFGSTQISSAGANASGNGIFEYDVPTGFTALSTKGLNL